MNESTPLDLAVRGVPALGFGAKDAEATEAPKWSISETSSEVRGEAALEQVRDDQGEQNERLDEGQAENHRRLDACSRAGISGDTFECGGSGAALTEGTTENRDADRNAGAHADPA